MQILCQNPVVKVSGQRKAVAVTAGGDMFWRRNATMTNDKMDENDPLCGGSGFKCKWILEATTGGKRQAKTVETPILYFVK